MATFNVEMRQRVSGAFSDIIYPKAHWNNIDGKPSTFAPTAHTHGVEDIALSGGVNYVTSCPTEINSVGMKFYVGSIDCATKYAGWSYLIIET